MPRCCSGADRGGVLEGDAYAVCRCDMTCARLRIVMAFNSDGHRASGKTIENGSFEHVAPAGSILVRYLVEKDGNVLFRPGLILQFISCDFQSDVCVTCIQERHNKVVPVGAINDLVIVCTHPSTPPINALAARADA